MGCHFIDLLFWALKLGHCETVEAEGPGGGSARRAAVADRALDVPRAGRAGAGELTWYHGDKYPAAMTEGKLGDWKARACSSWARKG